MSNSYSNDNLTLTWAELNACHPIRGENGHSLRAFCPIHGGDHQRSLRIDLSTGRFNCYACGAWGYTEEAREEWRKQHHTTSSKKSPQLSVHTDKTTSPSLSSSSSSSKESKSTAPKLSVLKDPVSVRTDRKANLVPVRDDLTEILQNYQKALPGGWGEEYLRQRGIPLKLALQYGAGYAASGCWVHSARDWKWGRVTFPHTDPSGKLINFYGRAVGITDKVPKEYRHDHLPGGKGYFNAGALHEGDEPVFVCEGVFDALSLIAAGYTRTVAIIGVNGWRWEWMRNVPKLVFALDADETGQRAWKGLAREAVFRGKQVEFLPPKAYGGCKDVNEAWVAGKLCLELTSPEILSTEPSRESELSSQNVHSTQRAIYDPRPDLATDSHLWEQLLEYASRLAETEIFGALHGLRCCGVQIALRGSYLILVPGELSPEEYVTLWNDCLSRRGKVVDGLLAQVKP
jgi:hypothetical protein